MRPFRVYWKVCCRILRMLSCSRPQTHLLQPISQYHWPVRHGISLLLSIHYHFIDVSYIRFYYSTGYSTTKEWDDENRQQDYGGGVLAFVYVPLCTRQRGACGHEQLYTLQLWPTGSFYSQFYLGMTFLTYQLTQLIYFLLVPSLPSERTAVWVEELSAHLSRRGGAGQCHHARNMYGPTGFGGVRQYVRFAGSDWSVLCGEPEDPRRQVLPRCVLFSCWT